MDLKPLITLLAIVNPLAIVPFFIHYTQGFSPAQRKSTIYTAAFSAFRFMPATTPSYRMLTACTGSSGACPARARS